MLNGDQFRLYPNPEQQQILSLAALDRRCQPLVCRAKVQEDRCYRRFPRRKVGTADEDIPIDLRR